MIIHIERELLLKTVKMTKKKFKTLRSFSPSGLSPSAYKKALKNIMILVLKIQMILHIEQELPKNS